MVLLLSHEDVKRSVDMTAAIEAMESCFAEEARGGVTLPQRINVKAGRGWLRVGPVVMEESGVMGFKAMNLAPGHGLRYQVHLYRIETGEVLSIMDAQYLTTLRTGATSAVATRRLARPGATELAVLGSGPESRAQLDAMHAAGFVRSARVFSPTKANRERLAEEARRELGIDIVAVDSAFEAVDGAGMVVAGVKSSTPVLMGEWLKPGVHVNSVGTARRDQREIDAKVFEVSRRIVVDTETGVFEEAGDAYAAKDVIDRSRTCQLCELVSGAKEGRQSDDEITLFKSVGTGIQDIALAKMIYENAKRMGLGRDIGEFPYLKSS